MGQASIPNYSTCNLQNPKRPTNKIKISIWTEYIHEHKFIIQNSIKFYASKNNLEINILKKYHLKSYQRTSNI